MILIIIVETSKKARYQSPLVSSASTSIKLSKEHCFRETQTSILPVVDCPEMSSPAQSFASVAQPICAPSSVAAASSRLACRKSSLAVTSLTAPLPPSAVTGVRPQHNSQDTTRPSSTRNSPAKNVMRLEHRNAYHWRSTLQSPPSDAISTSGSTADVVFAMAPTSHCIYANTTLTT